MAVVKGFRGILYNTEKTGDISRLVAPPYDVINTEEQNALYEKHPFNCVRLILSREPGEKRYADSAKTLKNWLDEEILRMDEKPAIYGYLQEFEFGGKHFTRKGFIARVKIEDFESGVILPHEKTFKKHKDDRLKLTSACEANLSQVFSIYSDPGGDVEKTLSGAAEKPFAEIDFGGIKNTLWRVNSPQALERVGDLMADKKLLIADGHHRYETAINYRNICRGENKPGDSHEYVMMFLSGAESDGLIVEPTHRGVKNFHGVSAEELALNLKKEFDCEETRAENCDEIRRDQSVFVYDGGKKAVIFSPKNSGENYMTMGVVTLQDKVIGEIIEKEMKGEPPEITYIKSRGEMLNLIKSGECEAGFIMPRPLIRDIMDASEKGVRMPQKTTYFYPKILSGIVINPLRD